jgi:hypothetical protein
MAAGVKRSPSNGGIVNRGPSGLLAVLDDDSVAGEQRADDRTKKVVERVAI